jgi:hypothetical protein
MEDESFYIYDQDKNLVFVASSHLSAKEFFTDKIYDDVKIQFSTAEEHNQVGNFYVAKSHIFPSWEFRNLTDQIETKPNQQEYVVGIKFFMNK